MMGIRFSADEILSIAETIERNGVGFYQTAAKMVSAEESRRLLLDLADREKAH
jgi:rubrerythrin